MLQLLLGPFKCYVTQWGCQISKKSVTNVYSSTLLALRGGCQISRKKCYITLEWRLTWKAYFIIAFICWHRLGDSSSGQLVGTYCGSDNLPEVIVSPRRHLWIRFVSDHSVSGEGFRLQYTLNSRCSHSLNDF